MGTVQRQHSLRELVMYKSGNCVHVVVVALVSLVALGFGSQIAQAAIVTWDDPVAITTADAVLSQPGTVASAVTWGPAASTVTLTGGKTINFVVGSIDGSSTVANVTATSAGNTGAFTGSTGNAAFDGVLSGFAGDGESPLNLTVHNLVAGHEYAIQLFAMDTRNPVVGVRQVCFSDTADQSGNNSAVVGMSENKYVMGTFTASGSSTTLYEQFLTFQDLGFAQGYFGNLNAVVVRDLTAIPEPGTMAIVVSGIIGLVAYAWRKRR